MVRGYLLFVLVSGLMSVKFGAASCEADNCLRAYSNYPSSASSFCNTYTVAPAPSIPAFASPCSSSASRLSSACSCFASTSKTTTSSTSSSSSNHGSTACSAASISTTTVTSTVTIGQTSNGTQISDILAMEANILSLEAAIMSLVTGLSPPSCCQVSVTAPASTVTTTVTAGTFTSTDDITLPGSTITSTVTDNIATITVSSFATPTGCNVNPAAQPTFQLQIIGGPENGNFGYLESQTSVDTGLSFDSTIGFPIALFTLNATCNLITASGATGGIAAVDNASGSQQVFFYEGSEILRFDYPVYVCEIEAGLLLCNANGYTIWEYCEDGFGIEIGQTYSTSCDIVELQVLLQ